MRALLTAFVAVFLTAQGALAQFYPDQTSPTINDFAGLIDSATEARINDRLAALKASQGTDIVIATLSSVSFYAKDMTIPEYATGLFNKWRVGRDTPNDGILLIVFRDDRELRVALGAGYDGAWDGIAKEVIDADILPAFRAGDYPGGIAAGVNGLIEKVAVPFHNGANAPVAAAATPTPEDPASLWWLLLPLGLIGAVVWGGRAAAKAIQNARKCENCGARGLRPERVTLEPATANSTGRGERRATCPSCGHVAVTAFTIAMLSSSSDASDSSGGGGGSSDGGGASGSW